MAGFEFYFMKRTRRFVARVALLCGRLLSVYGEFKRKQTEDAIIVEHGTDVLRIS